MSPYFAAISLDFLKGGSGIPGRRVLALTVAEVDIVGHQLRDAALVTLLILSLIHIYSP